MGRRLTQRILECDICHKIPEDGEYIWEMNTELWCEACCEKHAETDDDDDDDTNE